MQGTNAPSQVSTAVMPQPVTSLQISANGALGHGESLPHLYLGRARVLADLPCLRAQLTGLAMCTCRASLSGDTCGTGVCIRPSCPASAEFRAGQLLVCMARNKFISGQSFILSLFLR